THGPDDLAVVEVHEVDGEQKSQGERELRLAGLHAAHPFLRVTGSVRRLAYHTAFRPRVKQFRPFDPPRQLPAPLPRCSHQRLARPRGSGYRVGWASILSFWRWVMFTIPRTLLFALGLVLLYATPASSADKEPGFIGVQIKKDNDVVGILVQSVLENSPAEKAGIMSNDVITKLDGKKVEELGGFVTAI